MNHAPPSLSPEATTLLHLIAAANRRNDAPRGAALKAESGFSAQAYSVAIGQLQIGGYLQRDPQASFRIQSGYVLTIAGWRAVGDPERAAALLPSGHPVCIELAERERERQELTLVVDGTPALHLPSTHPGFAALLAMARAAGIPVGPAVTP